MARSTDRQFISLRARYLFASAIISILLVTGTLLASWYTNDISRKHSSTLALRNTITEGIQDTKNYTNSVNNLLSTMLVTPGNDYSDAILEYLQKTQKCIQKVITNPEVHKLAFYTQLNNLANQFENTRTQIEYLLDQRKDPNWVYPSLPYINNKLLGPNTTFETESLLALQDIAQEDGKAYASNSYILFAEARDLWRVKILNFRAVLVRVMGLNRTDSIPQNANIEDLHQQIEKKLHQLQKLAEQGKLGLQAETSLEKMHEASVTWNSNWHEFLKLRTSSNWRGDIEFLNKNVQPAQQALTSAIAESETRINQWSANSVELVTEASNKINNGLWLLTALALVFVVLVYLMIDYSVLKPITHIASVISSNEQNTKYVTGNRSSKEIHQLVDAFNNMRKQIHQRQLALEHQALHDSLTGLPNRSRLNDRLDQSISIMKRNEQKMALLILDLDRFKEINDTLGHQVGDLLLQHVANRLEKILRDSDTIARMGGDEFAIVAPNTDEQQAQKFCEKILSAVNEVFDINQQHLYVGASIGIAIYPDHGSDISTLTRHADIAMYDAKRNNRGFSIYDPIHDSTDVNRLSLVGHLREELTEASGLQIYYQPQIDLFSRETTGIEALLRWNHADLGFIAPEHIINLAEHSGMIGQLSNWVINTAIREYQQLKLANNNITLSINLSAWNLQDPELPDTIAKALQRYQMSATRLKLEVTESAMMNDPVRARHVMQMLDDMGIQLSVDDYGTGFSSLGYLKLLPVRELKIDKSFVLEMLEDENDAIIVHSTIELAHNLGLSVVAEGVENQDTLLKLRSLKCDQAQGYYISRAIPRHALEEWLKNHQPRVAL